MLRVLALVEIDVSEKRIAFIIRTIRIDELGKTLTATSNPSTLPRNIVSIQYSVCGSIPDATIYSERSPLNLVSINREATTVEKLRLR
jgi:hypothetical protein